MVSKSLDVMGITGARAFKTDFDLFIIHWFAPKFRTPSAFCTGGTIRAQSPVTEWVISAVTQGNEGSIKRVKKN